MANVLASIWDSVKGTYRGDGALHTGALLLFTALIPFFSAGAVIGSRLTAAKRSAALISTFPELGRTQAREAFAATSNRVGLRHFIMPLFFLLCLNAFFANILLDAGGWTDSIINGGRRVFLLCGGHCLPSALPATAKDQADLGTYETQTLVTVSYAFLGWMIWTFTSVFDRAATQQLYPATFNRLLIRLAVAVLVAIVARHLAAQPGAASQDATLTASGPVLAFVIGMFPERALTWITSKFAAFTRAPAHSEDFNLELIEGIDAATTYRLQELGIEDGPDLARANPFAIFEAVALPMTEAIDWIAQAQLLLLVKSDRFQIMQKAGYRTIFDAVRLLRSKNGVETVKGLCNWVIPDGYDQVAAITSDGDYVRLLGVIEAMSSVAP